MLFLVIALGAAILSLAVDLAAGHLIAPVPILGEFVRLSLSHNSGIAFGILLPSPWQEILIIGALTAVSFVAVRSVHEQMPAIGFGLIIGGAVANLADRFMDGVVTDFIVVGTFPVFNLADAFISIGAGLLVVEYLHQRKENGGTTA